MARHRKANGERKGNGQDRAGGAKATRAFWSGTITFGLVSIPVDFFAAVRGRNTAMKMVDPKGVPLGREYYSDKTEEPLRPDDLVRGYETDDGKTITVTDEELESIAPELTRDIEMRVFVPKEQIAPAYFDHPYFLAPSGRSAKAYQLLAEVMRETGRVGVGTFVMRGHQYLVAIHSDGQLLRAETLRFAGEVRSPDDVGLPKASKPAEKQVKAFTKAIQSLAQDKLDMDEMSDRNAARIHELVEKKEHEGRDVVDLAAPVAEAGEDGEAGGNVVDLMALLKQRVGAKAKPAEHGSHRRGHRTRRTKKARAA
jgi:DNA end-binding protein Ku